MKDVSVRNTEMRKPKVDNSLSWGRRKGHNVSVEDANLISQAASSLNKFSDDGSFMEEVLRKQRNDSAVAFSASVCEGEPVMHKVSEPSEAVREILNEGLSANQLAAKALQLRMKGKHDDAQKLMVLKYISCLWLALFIFNVVQILFASSYAYVKHHRSFLFPPFPG